MKKIISVACVLMIFSACRQQTRDGIVPEKVRPAAQKYVGDYAGSFAGRKLTMSFSIDNAGLASLRVKDSSGDNRLVADCSSAIGRLAAVEGDKKTQTLRAAYFKFDGTACGLAGSELQVQPLENNVLNLYIANDGHWEKGETECDVDEDGRTHCHHQPDNFVIDSWLSGTFKKK